MDLMNIKNPKKMNYKKNQFKKCFSAPLFWVIIGHVIIEIFVHYLIHCYVR